MTIRSVRARYRNGVLEPLDALELAEDQEVLLTLDDEEKPLPDPDAFVQAAGGWVGQFDDYQALIRDIYQARIDGSRQYHPRDL